MTNEIKVFIGIGIATLILVCGGIFLLSSTDPSSSEQVASGQRVETSLLVKDDSYKVESPKAKVTVVEFLDPECEACRAAYPTVKRAMKEYEGKVTFVVRYFPLHKNSVLAIKTLESAGEQGKYWEMLDKLFTNQSEWGEKQEPQTELFVKYAQELNLDVDKFKQSLENKAYEEKANRDRKDGLAAGVQGTPTFFINGVQAGNVMSYDSMKSAIDTELQK